MLIKDEDRGPNYSGLALALIYYGIWVYVVFSAFNFFIDVFTGQIRLVIG